MAAYDLRLGLGVLIENHWTLLLLCSFSFLLDLLGDIAEISHIGAYG